MTAAETELIGYAAGIVTTASFFPLTWRIVRTRQAREISLIWMISMIAGLSLWLLYGIVNNNPPIIAANGLTLLMLFVILFIRLRYR